MSVPTEFAGSLPRFGETSDTTRRFFRENGVVVLDSFFGPSELSALTANVERYRKWIAPRISEIVDHSVRYESDRTVRGMYYMDRADPALEAFAIQPSIREALLRVSCKECDFSSIETVDKTAGVGSESFRLRLLSRGFPFAP